MGSTGGRRCVLYFSLSVKVCMYMYMYQYSYRSNEMINVLLHFHPLLSNIKTMIIDQDVQCYIRF